MERGQEGRPAHGTDETIEAIELVGAPADEDAQDASIEDGASTEGPSPEHVPGSGPPAHWLAYVRARAPWLLSPGGGLLAEAASGSTPDVVPHGPAARVPPWPGVDPASRASAAATPTWPAVGGALTERAADRAVVAGDPPGEQPGRGGDRPGSFSGMPAIDVVGPEHPDRPLAMEDRSGRRESDGRPDTAPDEVAAPRSVAPIAPDADPASPSHAVTPGTVADEPGPEASRAAATPAADPFPSSDPTGPSRPPIAWPALPEPQVEAPGDPWPPPSTRTPRSEPPMPEPERPLKPRALAPAVPLRPPSRLDVTPRGLDGWHVRATAPETEIVARLALPPWPDLPDPPLDDDGDPDWRAIERRLQRAARLDREQRRR